MEGRPGIARLCLVRRDKKAGWGRVVGSGLSLKQGRVLKKERGHNTSRSVRSQETVTVVMNLAD